MNTATHLLYIQAQTSTVWSSLPSIWSFLLVAVMVVAALLLLLARRQKDVQVLETIRADSNEKLLKTRNEQIVDLTKELAEAAEDRDAIKTEYATLAGINIKELVKFWQERETILNEIEDLKAENRRLKKRANEPR